MRARTWIFWVLLGAMFLYEAYALRTPESGDTISELTWNTFAEAPFVLFLFGVLVGHFVWQRR